MNSLVVLPAYSICSSIFYGVLMCVIIQNSNFSTYHHISLAGILVSGYMMATIKFFNHCFPEDKYDTLEYSWVKATTVSVHLRIYVFALTNTNKLSGAVAREAFGLKILILPLISANLVCH